MSKKKKSNEYTYFSPQTIAQRTRLKINRVSKREKTRRGRFAKVVRTIYSLCPSDQERLGFNSKRKALAFGFISFVDDCEEMLNELLNKEVFPTDPTAKFRSKNKDQKAENNGKRDEFNRKEVPRPSVHCRSSMTPIQSYFKDDNIYLLQKISSGFSLEGDVGKTTDTLLGMLFLFQLCHVVFLVLPNKTFDLDFIRLLRTLQILKSLTSTDFRLTLANSAFTTDTKYTSLLHPGKILPSLCFLFLRYPCDAGESSERERLNQKGFEEEVRRLLKRHRLSGCDQRARVPLFFLDKVKLVYFATITEDFRQSDKLRNFTDFLFDLSGEEDESKKFHKRQLVYEEDRKWKLRDFLENRVQFFLAQCAKGSKRYALPTTREWYHASFSFEEMLYLPGQQHVRDMYPEATKISKYLDTVTRFSEKRCKEAYTKVKEKFGKNKSTTHANLSVQMGEMATLSYESAMETTLRTYNESAVGVFQKEFEDRLVQDIDSFYHEKKMSKERETLTRASRVAYSYRPPSEANSIHEFKLSEMYSRDRKKKKKVPKLPPKNVFCPYKCFSVRLHGTAASYDTKLGVPMSGGDGYQNPTGALLPAIEFDVPFVEMDPSSTFEKNMRYMHQVMSSKKMKNQGVLLQGKKKKKKKKKKAIRADHILKTKTKKKMEILVGFHYEAQNGKKFLLTAKILKAIKRTRRPNNEEPDSTEKLFRSDVPLFIKWPKHIFGPLENAMNSSNTPVPGLPQKLTTITDDLACLHKIFLVFPLRSSQFQFTPRILVEFDEVKYLYRTQETLFVEDDTFCEIQLHWNESFAEMTKEAKVGLYGKFLANYVKTVGM